MKIVIGLRHTKPHLAGDMAGMLDMVRLADAKGVYGLEISDHLIMAEGAAEARYPYGRAVIHQDTYFYEPLTMLAAYAAVTKRIRFSTHILVAPMRPAIFLAKQVATLDLIANGRFDLGIGAGWQKEEFDATPGAPWETRFGYMDEQVRICRALWGGAPAAFQGKYVSFERLHARPFPVQGANVPVFYGLQPSERNVARMAELADGWLPPPIIATPETLSPHLASLGAALTARGRDPKAFQIGVMPRPIKKNESDAHADLDLTLAQLPALAEAGATSAHLFPFNYGADYEGFLDRVVAAQD